MSASQSDRNVLFGILALQMEFITQAGLIAALQAWTLQKSKPIGELLVELGHMSPEDRAALEPMVDRHVVHHGGSAQQSLAALSSVSDVVNELRPIADDDLQQTLTQLPRRSSISASAAAPDADAGSRQRFELLRAHAEGGLGKVWIAKDRELNREVAFKEIKPSHAEDSGSRGRFVLEAEITGGLEHPGIVPIYSLGHYDNGRPFYAMRFIRGDSLKEAIDRFHQRSAVAGLRPSHPADQRSPISDADVAKGDLRSAKAAESETRAERGLGYVSREAFASVEFRQLLGRFVDVCNAIEYAHSRGVLHRDLKPGNIMLGKYGETLVVDWGLAKATGKADQFRDGDEATLQPSSGSGVEPTMLGSAIGTPAYMSPEQAAGRLDELGPATDVYSLGATLYHVLTGQSPFVGGNLAEILRRVQVGDFPRPREVASNQPERASVRFEEANQNNESNQKPGASARRLMIPLPLEAICLKAMSLRASDRYASTAALASDVERYLADEPVTAHAEPLSIRVRRWVKRHQVAVTSLAAAVVVALVGLGVLSVVVSGSNKRLNTANAAITTKNSELEVANQREREATAIARDQSQLALKSLESVIFDIQRKLEHVPGAGDLQRTLLQTAIARLQEVSDQFATRGAIDRNTKVALDDLGDVFLRIGTGMENGRRPPAGDPVAVASRSLDSAPVAAARKVYQQAFDMAQKLVAADPSAPNAQRDLSVSHLKLGDVQRRSGQVTEALGSYQKGLEIRQKLAAADPSDVNAQRDLWVAFSLLGDTQFQSRQTTEAQRSYQKCLEISQRLGAADPNDAKVQRDLWNSYNRLGNLQQLSGQANEARGSYQSGLEISQKLAAADPSNAQAHGDLSDSHDNLGSAQLASGHASEARGSFQAGLEIRQKLAAADPSDAQGQRGLSISFHRLGGLHLQTGKLGEARDSYQQMLEINQKLAANDPHDTQAQRELSKVHTSLGNVHFLSGQLTEALALYQQGLEIIQKLAAADPNDGEVGFDLAVGFMKLGLVENKQKRYEQAIESFGSGLKVLRSLNEQKRLPPKDQKWIETVELLIWQSQFASTAIGDWKTLLEQPAKNLPVLLEMRGTQLVQEGRAGDAVQAVAKLRELGTATADQLYNAACVYSLCAAGIKPEKDELTAEQAAQRQKHIAQAIETLREAIKAGYKDFAHMQKDGDLVPLHNLPEFKALFPQ